MKLFLVIFLLVFISSSGAQCPPGCSCQGTAVKCLGTRMKNIPRVSSRTTILDLKFNSIEDIAPGAFSGLPNLHTLFLNGNNITQLDDDTFEGLQQLKILHLDRNHISHISDTAFSGLNKLQDLFLSNNEIESLDEGVFSDLVSLERLFISNNLLEVLSSTIPDNIPRLKKIGLDGNPIHCDCGFAWLERYARENKLLSPLFCTEPRDMEGRPAVQMIRSLKCSRPEIISGIHEVEIKPGETASFQCQTRGTPTPTITWLLNNTAIDLVSSNGQFEILDDGSLLIHEVQNMATGFYKCLARNILGSVQSQEAELKLLDTTRPSPPRIIVKPEDRAVLENGAASISCVVIGYPVPDIRWTINERPLPLDPRFHWDSTGTLTLTNLKPIDAGMYRCVAMNSVGMASEFARVQVFTAPVFITKPQNQKVVERHSVFFSCDVTAEPPATISWQKNDFELHNSDRININPSGSTLTISLVEKQDEGTYQCTADNLGGVAKASAKLTISSIAAPRIFRPPSDVSVLLGSTVKLDCVVGSGDPVPVVRWQKGNNPLSLTSNEKYEVTAGGSLIINEVEYSDEGTYECLAENLAGVDQAFATLTIRDTRFQPITQQHISRTVLVANRQVNSAIDNTRRELFDLRHRPRNPQDLLRLNRYPSARALSLSRAAEIFEQTFEQLFREIHEGAYFNITPTLNVTYEELLTPSQLSLIASLSGCEEHRRIVETCDDLCFHRKYRSFDGTCNNFHNTMLGSSLSMLTRLRPPRYENNFNLPIGWDSKRLHNGFPLPSARKVSLDLISTKDVTPDDQYTHMLMQWGQFLDHDLDFVPTAVSNARFSDGRFCNETCNSQSPCFPIPVGTDDPRVRKQRCIGFVRSSSMCGSGMTSAIFGDEMLHRQQLNSLTAFIDGSNVYGSSEEDAFNLRDHTSNGGLLRVGVYSSYGFDKRLLPPNQGEFVDCMVDPNTAHVPCFQAGDHRVNEQLGLLTMHTLWFREHNRLASKLQRMNSHWNSDTAYHETRKIVGAVMQHITYEHWLPKVLGHHGMHLIGRYRGYNSSVDPSISNEFASAAFRFGHTLINPIMSRLNESFQPIREGNLPLHKAFFAPFRLIEEGGVDPILRGLYGVPAKRLVPGEFLNSELTERLFVLAHDVAQDLAAFNIQRGRDHGLQSYNSYREYCGLHKARNFEDLRNEIRNHQVRKKLEDLYGHPDNIDLFAGGVAEDVMDGARIGPTFVCIISEQFKRLRDGDRFFYENPGVFSSNQLHEIKKVTLARVICDNSDNIHEVQKDVFSLMKSPSELLRCESRRIEKMDLKVWSQCCEDCSRSGDFRSVRSRRSVDENVNENVKINKEKKEDEKMDGVLQSWDTKFEDLEELVATLRKQIFDLEEKISIMQRG